MQDSIRVSSALISVFDKKGLDSIVEKLHQLGVTIYSTGGTADYIDSIGVEVIRVESITDYPSILGGRVKTLHPKVFGGILNRRNHGFDRISCDIQRTCRILMAQDRLQYECPISQGSD